MFKIKRRECDIPMASMSDIAFLLIIFFIISMSFVYRQGIKVQLPKKDSPPAVLSSKSILLLTIDREGNYYKGGIKMQLEKISIMNECAAIIKVDQKCRYKYLVALLEYLQRRNINKVSIKKDLL